RSGIARAANVRVIGVISASLATSDGRNDPLALFEVTSSEGDARRAQAEARRRGMGKARAVGQVWYRHNEDWTPAARAAVEQCLRSLR
ncbi:MAG TPA: hypothetical protein VNT54_13655, partial [Solirubrobacteraceae bacterium]|nr:hypothetical protein [Solirubrobacteraceae bacterium]